MAAHPSTTESYRFGPYCVDAAERRLLRDGVPVALTPKAFDLLLILVENPGHLLDKHALMTRLWQDTFVEEANLANNISLLRKVLSEGAPDAEYIETVPRRGYRFLGEVTTASGSNGRPASALEAPESSLAPGARGDLAAVAPASVMAPQARRRLVAAVTVLLVGVAVLFGIRRRFDNAMSNARVVRFTVLPPAGASLPPPPQPLAPAISPDGTRLAFRVLRAGEPLLATRSIDALDARILAGTERARFPFWSADGRVVAFFADGKLKKIDAAGGPVQTLCDAAPGFGGSWNRDGTIVFAPSATAGLFKVPAAGGQATPVTSLQAHEAFHQHPQFLPDGRRFLYFAAPDGIYLGALDGRPPVRVLTNARMALYSLGYLLFVEDRTVFAQRFDADRARLSGDPIPLGGDVRTGGVGERAVGGASIAVSENGVLAYGTAASPRLKLAWIDRAGRTVSTIGVPERWAAAELSPDGKQIATEINAQPDASSVWLVDVASGHSTQLTFGRAVDRRPIWSPDGHQLAFSSSRADTPGIYQKSVTGERPAELLFHAERSRVMSPSDWTSAGIVYAIQNDGLWMLPLEGDRKPRLLVREPSIQPDAKVSPDERWLAYTSQESGRPEVFVQAPSTPGAKWKISTEGGSLPRWRRDGKELFYLAADGRLMAVPVDADATTLRPGVPQALFKTGLSELPMRLRSFGISRDGQRFLVATSQESGSTLSVVVVSNWQTGLRP